MPELDDGDVRIWHGDALEQLALMPSESAHCIVTSPPFWGLRDYGTGSWVGGDEGCDHLGPPMATKANLKNSVHSTRGGANHVDREPFKATCGKCGASRVDQQIGLEETPDEWCAKLVAVMREARRVLRSDGVAWIEVGDTYANGGSSGPQRDNPGGGLGASQSNGRGEQGYATASAAGARVIPSGVKPKDLVGAPWLLAFALRADGWYLRSDTIWARPNPMPESVTDRPTKAHSYVFLLTKSARYFYDADAIREDGEGTVGNRRAFRGGGAYTAGQSFSNGATIPNEVAGNDGNPAGRNARSVWSIPTEPTPFAHFATFPQALVERCIKAGTSEHGACSECGAPWRRITEASGGVDRARPHPPKDDLAFESGVYTGGKASSGLGRPGWREDPPRTYETLGWEPSCDHDAPVVPCVCLDPFMGSGTTALVARRLGRHAIGIELNAEYLAIARTRLQQPTLWSDLA